MEYVLTNTQMRAADEYTIKTLGVESLVLMERAGKAIAECAETLAPSGGILCVCGGGNNGGDGFVCARILREKGRKVSVVFFSEKISGDCRANQERYLAAGGEIRTEFPERERAVKEYALVIDCLLGTGFHGELATAFAEAAEEINALKRSGLKVLAADIPSGVNGNDGSAAEHAVCATHTLCIGEKKAGTRMRDGLDRCGEVFRADIGIVLPEKPDAYAILSDKQSIKEILPKRKRNSHKGMYGRAAIVAGSEEYTGAAALSAGACLRAGAGYTALFTPAKILPFYVLKFPEALLQPLNDGGRVAFSEENFEKLLAYDCIAYGMGMGRSEETAKGAVWLLRNYRGKLILDADALNSLAAYAELEKVFSAKKCDVVLTPHIKEFSRLTGESVQTVVNNGLTAPVAFARKHGVNVLLKDAATILTDGSRVVLNTVGSAGQAKGGSGDVLSGVIAGLCAAGLCTFDAARAGAYLTGRAAEIATEETGAYSLLASDVIAALGKAFLDVFR